jgi:hypothetical protein
MKSTASRLPGPLGFQVAEDNNYPLLLLFFPALCSDSKGQEP